MSEHNGRNMDGKRKVFNGGLPETAKKIPMPVVKPPKKQK